jgi:fumarate reductase subunit C
MSQVGYQRRMSIFWWVRKPTYFLFVMRELSSLFVAWFVAYLLMFIAAVGNGEAAYRDFLDKASHPALVTLNVVALAFVVLHTITWFALTPQAMVVRAGGREVPGVVIIAAQYAGMLVVSAFVAWLVTR